MEDGSSVSPEGFGGLKPVCWSSCFKNRCNPLMFSFIRLKFLSATYVSQTMLEGMLILFMLASGPLECDFVSFLQLYVAPASMASQVIWQFVSQSWFWLLLVPTTYSRYICSAALTDWTERHAQYLLMVTVILQTALDIAMFFVYPNQWVVLGLYIIRFSLVQQIGNSGGKIIKMRLDGVLRATPDQQLAAFNSISITGEIVGRSLVVFGVYAVSLIFIRVNLIPFEWVRNLFFITMGIGDIFALVSALTIRSAYFVSPDYGEQPIVSTQEDPPPNSEYYLYLNDPDFPFFVFELFFFVSSTYAPITALSRKNPILRFLIYVFRATKVIYKTKILWCASVHQWILMILLAFVSIVLRFAVTDTSEPVKTRDNFCGGQLYNLIEQQTYWEVSRMGAAMLFSFVFSKVSPLHFYRRWNVVFGFGLLVATIFIYFQGSVGATVSSVNLGFINMIIYINSVLDNNLGSAVVEPSIVGWVFGLNGSMGQLLAMIPTALVAINTPEIGFIALFALGSGLVTIYAYYFARAYRRPLLKLEEGVPVAPGCFNKLILGRRDRSHYVNFTSEPIIELDEDGDEQTPLSDSSS